jgi:SAM-dependent methyltransferase
MTAAPRPIPVEFSDYSLPEVQTEAVPRCVVCGGRKHAPFSEGYDYELKTCRNRWVFTRCADCGHVWLNPRPVVSALSVIYPRTYYAYTYEKIPAIARRSKEVLDALKMRSIVKQLERPPRSFVDIGCGNGRFLDAMAKRGIPRDRIYGLELDDTVVARLRERGYQAFCERVETCTNIPAGSIDLATMFHVIEHVDAPDAVLARIAEWLAPGGVLAIETPNLESMDARLFRDRYWGGYHIPRHWHLFSPRTLERLLAGAGLTPVATMFQTGHSFWMYSFHHWLRYEPSERPRLARHFDPIRNVGPLALFTLFDKIRGALGARTSAMLMIARKAP